LTLARNVQKEFFYRSRRSEENEHFIKLSNVGLNKLAVNKLVLTWHRQYGRRFTVTRDILSPTIFGWLLVVSVGPYHSFVISALLLMMLFQNVTLHDISIYTLRCFIKTEFVAARNQIQTWLQRTFHTIRRQCSSTVNSESTGTVYEE